MPQRDIILMGHVVEASDTVVKQKLGEARYQAIKAADPDPCFALWRVMAEGFSTGGFQAEDGKVKKFVRRAKKWLPNAIKTLGFKLNPKDGKPIPVYRAKKASPHPESADKIESKRGEQVGTVEAGWPSRDPSKALAANCITYHRHADIKRSIRAGSFDTCSVEARVAFRQGVDRLYEIMGVDAAKALVITSRDALRAIGKAPGYSGASLMAVVAEFDNGLVPEADGTVDIEDEYFEPSPMPVDFEPPVETERDTSDEVPQVTEPVKEINTMPDEQLTREQMQRTLRVERYKPSEVYDEDDLLRDRRIKELLEAEFARGKAVHAPDIERLTSEVKEVAAERDTFKTERDEFHGKLRPYRNAERLTKLSKQLTESREKTELVTDKGILEDAIADVKTLNVPEGKDPDEFMYGELKRTYERYDEMIAKHAPPPASEEPPPRPSNSSPPRGVQRYPQPTPGNEKPAPVEDDIPDDSWAKGLEEPSGE